MPKTQLAKWGNSLAVRIPKAVAEQVRLQEGDSIVIEALEGHIELRPAEKGRTLEELVAPRGTDTKKLIGGVREVRRLLHGSLLRP
jgi:AbrB family looped-hinge helix DNA binding protein